MLVSKKVFHERASLFLFQKSFGTTRTRSLHPSIQLSPASHSEARAPTHLFTAPLFKRIEPVVLMRLLPEPHGGQARNFILNAVINAVNSSDVGCKNPSIHAFKLYLLHQFSNAVMQYDSNCPCQSKRGLLKIYVCRPSSVLVIPQRSQSPLARCRRST